MNFREKLLKKVIEKRSVVCVGILAKEVKDAKPHVYCESDYSKSKLLKKLNLGK